MFGLFGKKKEEYPLMTSETIEPTDMLITTTEAKRIFKYFMKEIDFIEKDELSDRANDLGDVIREEMDTYKDTVSDQKLEISEEKKQLKEIKNSLKQCEDDSKEEIESELQDQIDHIAGLTDDLDLAVKELPNTPYMLVSTRAFIVKPKSGSLLNSAHFINKLFTSSGAIVSG